MLVSLWVFPLRPWTFPGLPWPSHLCPKLLPAPVARLVKKSGGKCCFTKWLGMVFLQKPILLAAACSFEKQGHPVSCQGWEAGGVRLLHGSTAGKDTFFLLAVLYFHVSHLLNAHKSGKDLQVLCFVHAVYQELIRGVVQSAGIPDGTSGASPAPYQPGASAACAPEAAPALTWSCRGKDRAFQCFLSSS